MNITVFGLWWRRARNKIEHTLKLLKENSIHLPSSRIITYRQLPKILTKFYVQLCIDADTTVTPYYILELVVMG